MKNTTNNIIITGITVSLIALLFGGIRKPELFEKEQYSMVISSLVGGLLGAVTANQSNNDSN